MSFLTISGSDVSVAEDSVSEERELIGTISRAFSGAARYDLRRHKRKWTMETTPLAPVEYTALLALVDVTTGTVSIGGDLVDGSPLSAYAMVMSSNVVSRHISGSWQNNLRVVSLEIWEA